jgi:hypothetical protein
VRFRQAPGSSRIPCGPVERQKQYRVPSDRANYSSADQCRRRAPAFAAAQEARREAPVSNSARQADIFAILYGQMARTYLMPM